MKNRIYLDLDGVLNRWQLHEVSRRVGYRVTEADWPLWLGWDIVAVCNHLTPNEAEQMTPAQFWNTVPESSWVEAPTSEIFEYLLEASADLVGHEHVHVLTAQPSDNNPVAYSGKRIWCDTHLPAWLRDKVTITKDKAVIARPGFLLIDDADHNYEDWTAQGGECCLVPRPWNQNHALDTKEFVSEFMFSLKQHG